MISTMTNNISPYRGGTLHIRRYHQKRDNFPERFGNEDMSVLYIFDRRLIKHGEEVLKINQIEYQQNRNDQYDKCGD